MRALFNRQSLRTKLALGFGVILGVMMVTGAIVFAGQINSARDLERFFAVDERLGKLSDASLTALETSRKYEKEFLLSQRTLGLEEAKARYLPLFHVQLAAVRGNLVLMREANRYPQVEASMRALELATNSYASGFDQVVDLYARLGHTDTGLEGEMRVSAHVLETMLASQPLRLQLGLLALRRHEKDFILRGQQRYVQNMHDAIGTLRADVQVLLPSVRRALILDELERYRAAFARYEEMTSDIERVRYDYLDAVNRMEPELALLGRRADAGAAGTRQALRDWSRLQGLIIVVCGMTVMLLGVSVARFIVRNIKGSVDEGVAFAQRLSMAEWNARLPVPIGQHEFARLAKALNGMADELQAMHARELTRNAELQRANRSLRLRSHCNELLVRARSERRLLSGLCRYLVDDGGYPLVWVGVTPPGKQELELVAHRGARFNAAPAIDQLPGFAFAAAVEALKCGGAVRGAVQGGSGLRACVALPLRVHAEFVGVVSICSAHERAFDDDELRMLRELAGDLAFGMASHRERERRAAAEHALDYHTHHDAVTGLGNREACAQRLQREIEQAAHGGRCVGVLVLTLDRLKSVRSTLGHEAGNQLLRHAADALRRELRDDGMLARLTGDEFAVVLPDISDAGAVTRVADKLLRAAALPCPIDGTPIFNSASVGASLSPRDGIHAFDLLLAADAAMACAQVMGGNRLHFYESEMGQQGRGTFSLEAELRRAIDQGELRVHYQPRALLSDGGIAGAEALVRWQHPVRGMVPPSDFIPLAEQSGLILPLGAWVLREVCRQLRVWQDAGLPPLVVAVNLSPRQFREARLVEQIRASLDEFGLKPSMLGLEITESTVIDNLDDAARKLRALKEIGLVLSLDDFGTGHSSLSRLRELPIDHLKIDQSFVRKLTSDPSDAAICRSIIDLAHNLKLTVIAEGVETEGQANFLRQHRCDEIQGYYFSRPLAPQSMTEMLSRGARIALPALDAAQGRTLLIVDDEPNVLNSLQRLLRREGYRILAASGGAQALDMLACERVQVVLSDQRMPGMCGADFLARVLELYPETVRMMLSGYSDLQTVTDTVNRGAISKFIAKPWDDEQLRADIRAAFRRAEATHPVPAWAPSSPAAPGG